MLSSSLLTPSLICSSLVYHPITSLKMLLINSLHVAKAKTLPSSLYITTKLHSTKLATPYFVIHSLPDCTEPHCLDFPSISLNTRLSLVSWHILFYPTFQRWSSSEVWSSMPSQAMLSTKAISSLPMILTTTHVLTMLQLHHLSRTPIWALVL